MEDCPDGMLTNSSSCTTGSVVFKYRIRPAIGAGWPRTIVPLTLLPPVTLLFASVRANGGATEMVVCCVEWP